MELSEIRKEIDRVDGEIRKLFMERMDLADRVACIKAKTADVIYKPDRERAIIEKQTEGVEEKLIKEYTALIKRMMEVSRKYQYGRMLEVRDCFPFAWETEHKDIKKAVLKKSDAFLGDIVKEEGAVARQTQIAAVPSMEEVGRQVKEGRADAGIGVLQEVGVSVSDELHMVLLKNNLYINKCIVREERGIRKKIVIFTDTLQVLPEHNRVKIMFGCPNRSGSLSSILSMISDYGVNATEIHSLPFREGGAWNYHFFAELAVNIDTKESRAMLYQLSQETQRLTLLGSYRCEGDFPFQNEMQNGTAALLRNG